MLKTSINNPDYLGVTANVLCMIHCFATPLLFLFQAQNSALNHDTLFLWQSFNYLFLLISLIAVFFSIKNSTKLIVKIFLMIFWLVLSFLIINEGLEMIYISEFYTYFSASALSFLHIYNLKYCTCKDEDCCVH